MLLSVTGRKKDSHLVSGKNIVTARGRLRFFVAGEVGISYLCLLGSIMMPKVDIVLLKGNV